MNYIADVVKTTIAIHGNECIFLSDTIERCVASVEASGFIDTDSIIEVLTIAFKKCELYCPHEGINRLPTI